MTKQVYYLPSSKKEFSQTGLINHFKTIKDSLDKQGQTVVTDEQHIADLKYFIQHYYIESERIQAEINLDNCEFFIALPPEPKNSHKCFWIKDNSKNKQQHFATTKNGLKAPSDFDNFYEFCTIVIAELKKQVRQELAIQSGKSFTEVDLWHDKPTTKEIVKEFIQEKQISDKLNLIISPNGLGNREPFLLSDYEYLKDEFLHFYHNKVSKQKIDFVLKNRNS